VGLILCCDDLFGDTLSWCSTASFDSYSEMTQSMKKCKKAQLKNLISWQIMLVVSENKARHETGHVSRTIKNNLSVQVAECNSTNTPHLKRNSKTR